MSKAVDFVVVGGGIAGASVAANLAATHSVALLERENRPGYHATGISAALFSTIYGGTSIRALSRASAPFFTAPPEGFSDAPLVTNRGALYISRADQKAELMRFAGLPDVAAGVHFVDGAEACRLSPLLCESYVCGALYERDAQDIDVNALHQGYLRELRRRGGDLLIDTEVRRLERCGSVWRVVTSSGELVAPTVVNAAGAWADQVAALAGVPPAGVVPRRRTALLVEIPPVSLPWQTAPLTIDIDEQFYFKPDAGLMLLSPADETPTEAGDAQPEELDVAMAIDRFQSVTGLQVQRVRARWAGLRSFAADRQPVVGYDSACQGFFWLAGQGGYGIQSAPALGRLAAALVLEEDPPEDILFEGLETGDISPDRLSRGRPASSPSAPMGQRGADA